MISEKYNQKIINVAELAEKDWDFVENYYQTKNTNWYYYSANPVNQFERLIKRPKVGRYRACFQASRQLTHNSNIIISHLPRMTHWQSIFMRAMGKHNPHMAFAFNFTHLPSTFMRKAMIKSLSRVDKFVVFSNFEKTLYSNHFEIPINKISMLHWAMERPITDELCTPSSNEYYCAVGGEGRDYKTLISAFKKLTKLNLIIVTRLGSLEGITIPDNVNVFYNAPATKFWRIVSNSKAVIVPLLNENIACGHITLVGAMQFGRPIITSFSNGTTDYIENNTNGLVVPPRSSTSLTTAIETLESDPTLRKQLGNASLKFSKENCNPVAWANYIGAFVQKHSR